MNYSKLPETLRDGIKAYIEKGYPMGSFLTAVAAHDLFGAVGRADDQNILRLREIVAWWHYEAPSRCHGSYEKVTAWIAPFEAKRRAEREREDAVLPLQPGGGM